MTKDKIKLARSVRAHIDVQVDALVPTLLAGLAKSECSSSEVTKLAKFLRTEEAQVYMRTIVTALLTNQMSVYQDAFIAQLSGLLRLVVGLSDVRADSCAEPTYVILRDSAERAVKQITFTAPQEMSRIQQLAWHEAQAGSLSGLMETSWLLNRRTPSDMAAIHKFARDYCRIIHTHHQYIVPPHLDDKRRVPIDDLYITPRFNANEIRFHALTTRSTEDRPQLPFDRLLRRLYRAVVLGDPGAGKSTLAQKLTFDFSGPDWADNENGGRLCIPFLVTLRDYALHKRRFKSSILQYIESYINSEHQIVPPPGAIEYLCASGRALIIFDGLDELLETYRRQEVVNAVESLGGRCPVSDSSVTG